jgi:hypothetical protein
MRARWQAGMSDTSASGDFSRRLDARELTTDDGNTTSADKGPPLALITRLRT